MMYTSNTSGKENVIADTLSRIAFLKLELQDCNSSLSNIERIPVYQITQTASASPERLQEICEATAKNSTLRMLTNIVHEGWPKTKTVHAVHSLTGISEMRSHVKMESCTKEQD